jgi:hypothetical protein
MKVVPTRSVGSGNRSMVSSSQLDSGISSCTLPSLTWASSELSVYIYSDGLVRIFVPIYIDDNTFACKDAAAIDRAVEQLAGHFKCCNLGPTEFLLGVGRLTEWLSS